MRNLVKIDPDQVKEHNVLSSASLEELGCCTPNCTAPVSHIALVELVLVNGRTLVVTKPYCSICVRVLSGVAQA